MSVSFVPSVMVRTGKQPRVSVIILLSDAEIKFSAHQSASCPGSQRHASIENWVPVWTAVFLGVCPATPSGPSTLSRLHLKKGHMSLGGLDSTSDFLQATRSKSRRQLSMLLHSIFHTKVQAWAFFDGISAVTSQGVISTAQRMADSSAACVKSPVLVCIRGLKVSAPTELASRSVAVRTSTKVRAPNCLERLRAFAQQMLVCSLTCVAYNSSDGLVVRTSSLCSRPFLNAFPSYHLVPAPFVSLHHPAEPPTPFISVRLSTKFQHHASLVLLRHL